MRRTIKLMKDKGLVYIVVDIEANGPAPGIHSMLSIAAVATTAMQEKGSFYRKMLPLEGTIADPDTETWWQSHPDALQEVNTDQEPADDVVQAFVAWVDSMSPEPIFVASPLALDYTFISWYLHNLVRKNPFIGEKNSFRTLDLRSLITGKFNIDFPRSTRHLFPAELTIGMPEHSHKAIDDAKGYAVLLRTILSWGNKPNPYRK